MRDEIVEHGEAGTALADAGANLAGEGSLCQGRTIALGLHALAAGDGHCTPDMVRLTDDEEVLRAENIPRTHNGIIGTETGKVFHNHLRGDTALDESLLHIARFVVVAGTVIARNNDAAQLAGVPECGGGIHTAREVSVRPATDQLGAAEHKSDAISGTIPELFMAVAPGHSVCDALGYSQQQRHDQRRKKRSEQDAAAGEARHESAGWTLSGRG